MIDDLDMSDVVESLKNATITRRRYDAGSFVNGRQAAAASHTDTSLDACVQPVPGREAERLGLGERSSEARVVWVASGELLESDDVIIGGDTYGIVNARDWNTTASYTRAVVARRGSPG
jgi:hypothetical protein